MDMDKRKIVMIRGYTQHGKDTVGSLFTSGSHLTIISNDKDEGIIQSDTFKWSWKCNNNRGFELLNMLINSRDYNFHTYACASTLKKMVASELLITTDFLEKHKDSYMPGTRDKYRSKLIERAKEIRSKDIDAFIRPIPKFGDVVVTDFRNENEIEYVRKLPNVKVYVLQVFNRYKPVPDIQIESEHGLDNYPNDIRLDVL